MEKLIYINETSTVDSQSYNLLIDYKPFATPLYCFFPGLLDLNYREVIFQVRNLTAFPELGVIRIGLHPDAIIDGRRVSEFSKNFWQLGKDSDFPWLLLNPSIKQVIVLDPLELESSTQRFFRPPTAGGGP